MITILVPGDRLASSLQLILNRFKIKDLEISDPPIEHLMGELFSVGKVDK